MLTPIESAREAIDAVTAETDYAPTAKKSLALPFFRSLKTQEIVRAWMEFAVPKLVRSKTKEEAYELLQMLKPFRLSDEEAEAYERETYLTRNASLYAAAEAFLSAFTMLAPVLLRFEELTVENKGTPESKEKPLYDESAEFWNWCRENKDTASLASPVLAGRLAFLNRPSLKSAAPLKKRADDMLESLLRMKPNIDDWNVKGEEIEAQMRFSVAARISAAVMVIDLMQRNADWLGALTEEIIKVKGQYKRLFGRKRSDIPVPDDVKKHPETPVDEKTAEEIVGILFECAETAGRKQDEAEAFFG